MTPSLTVEVITLFPEMFHSVLAGSLLGKAIERGLVAVHFTDPRQWAPGKHRAVDDTPYGGGGGMVMRADVLSSAIAHAERERGPARKILLGPGGTRLDRATIERLCRLPRLLLVCGRYEGIDDRLSSVVDEELSLGDFVMTGGEIAAMAIIDACARRLPGVLGNDTSAVEESFEQGLLEHPHYTRPPDLGGASVPEVLLSGDHEKIRRWRRQQSLLRTRTRRPDLFARHRFTDEDRRLLAEAGALGPDEGRGALAARTYVALCHHPVLDREGAIVTTAVTNLDIHDLARSSRTYDLAGVFLVTPIEAQRALCESILGEWRADNQAAEAGTGARPRSRPPRRSLKNEHRQDALSRVAVAASIEEAAESITRSAGAPPLLVATSARPVGEGKQLDYGTLPHALEQAAPDGRPILILLGTGWGLADRVVDRVDRCLAPIQGAATYNHLSVRSAAAITLDRLFGDRP